jgi:protein TonB
VSKSQYLTSFGALLVSAILVCGTLVLFQTASRVSTSWLDAEPSVAPYAVADKGWDRVAVVEPVAQHAVPSPAFSLEQAEPDTASTPPAQPAGVALAARASVPVSSTEGDGSFAPRQERFDDALREAAIESVLADAAPEPVDTPDPVEERALVSEGNAEAPEPERVRVAELDDIPEGSASSVTVAPEAAPDSIAKEPAPEEVEVTEPEEPADALDGNASRAKAAPEPVTERTPASQKRRSESVKTAEIVVSQEKPAPRPAARQERQKEAARPERQQAAQPLFRWKPMALAPIDKPAAPKISSGKPKLAPRAVESAGAHRSKVWAKLARSKPRAGQRGSATVSFTIGAGGALRSARVAKSSGNARLDQMALATVRKAAPFPPPSSLSGASYSIRIDFR